MFFADTFANEDFRCFEELGATGLVRTVDGDLEAVFTPEQPGLFVFASAELVSGGTEVSSSTSDVESTWRITPVDPAADVVLRTRVICEGASLVTSQFHLVYDDYSADAWTPVYPE